MLWSLAYVVVRRLFELVVLLCRSQGSKELEILVLRHELSILRLWARKYDPAANGHFRTADEFMHPTRGSRRPTALAKY